MSDAEWLAILAKTRDFCQRAYNLQPAMVGELAAARMLGPERVPMAVEELGEPLPGRCENCSQPIRADRRSLAKYCADRCRRQPCIDARGPRRSRRRSRGMHRGMHATRIPGVH